MLSWNEAENQCTDVGAHLVFMYSVIAEKELEQFVSNLALTNDIWLGGRFGVYYDTPYVLWSRWSDILAFTYFYTTDDVLQWETWKTKNYPGECMAMEQSSGYEINRNCSIELPFICRKLADYYVNEDLGEDLGNGLEALWWEIMLYCLAGLLILVLIFVGFCCWGTAGCFISGGKPCGSNLCHGACSCCCCKKKNNKTAPMEIPQDNLNYNYINV